MWELRVFDSAGWLLAKHDVDTLKDWSVPARLLAATQDALYALEIGQ